MALSIAGITGISGAPGVGGLSGISGIAGGETPGAKKAGGGSFSEMLTNAMDSVQNKLDAADQAAMGVATGDVTASEYLTAATDAQLTVQLAVAVRNRAVEAFNEIMRMPV